MKKVRMAWFITIIVVFALAPLHFASADFPTSLANLNALRADVEAEERVIKRLLYNKRKTKDPQVLRRIMAEVVKKYDEMDKAVEKYERVRIRIKVRYPSQSAVLKKFHPKYQFRPLERMMKEDGVPEMLDRMAQFLVRQYGSQEIGEVSLLSKGNISGDMKAYQIQLQKQQAGFDEWADRPVLER
jgi:hypothetical protein